MTSDQRLRESLGRELYGVAVRRGPFRLRSGEYTTEYFDKYLIEADPKLLLRVCQNLRKLVPHEAEVIAGLELGGLPIATILSQITGLSLRFVRKHAKEYGTGKLSEGGSIRGKQVVVIDDGVTAGGAVIQAIKALRAEGAIVNDVVCVLELGSGGVSPLKQFDVKIHRLFSMEELKTFASNAEAGEVRILNFE
jgi:orotate phosphoribosyltransferase